jgi:hypothetical protein
VATGVPKGRQQNPELRQCCGLIDSHNVVQVCSAPRSTVSPNALALTVHF